MIRKLVTIVMIGNLCRINKVIDATIRATNFSPIWQKIVLVISETNFRIIGNKLVGTNT